MLSGGCLTEALISSSLSSVSQASTATLAPSYPRPSSTPGIDPCFEFETLAWTLWNPSRFTVFTRDPADPTAAQRCPPVPPQHRKDVVCVAAKRGGLKVFWACRGSREHRAGLQPGAKPRRTGSPRPLAVPPAPLPAGGGSGPGSETHRKPHQKTPAPGSGPTSHSCRGDQPTSSPMPAR